MLGARQEHIAVESNGFMYIIGGNKTRHFLRTPTVMSGLLGSILKPEASELAGEA